MLLFSSVTLCQKKTFSILEDSILKVGIYCLEWKSLGKNITSTTAQLAQHMSERTTCVYESANFLCVASFAIAQ